MVEKLDSHECNKYPRNIGSSWRFSGLAESSLSEYNIKVELEKKTYVYLRTENQDILFASLTNRLNILISCFAEVCRRW